MFVMVVVACPLLCLGLEGPRQEEIGAQKDWRVDHHTSKFSLKIFQQSSGSLQLPGRIIGHSNATCMGRPGRGGTPVPGIVFQVRRCVICGNDKEAVPCLPLAFMLPV